jgi:hypothetical protein
MLTMFAIIENGWRDRVAPNVGAELVQLEREDREDRPRPSAARSAARRRRQLVDSGRLPVPVAGGRDARMPGR